MVKQVHYTKITPLPSNVPRLLAVDLLHSHDEFIKLNPLVTGVKAIEAPRNAAADEYFSNWYEISELLSVGLGMKKKVSFNGVFHNQPWGLQTHVFAPGGVEMRNKYRIGGNQPGEPREAREMGIDTPADGLYLREDISFTAAVPLTAGYVKKGMKEASQVMIDRMTRKAELLDEGKLHAMFRDGMLKTAKPGQLGSSPNPGDRASTLNPDGNSGKPMPSPGLSGTGSSDAGSPGTMQTEFSQRDTLGSYTRYDNLIGRNVSQRSGYVPEYQRQGYSGPQYEKPGAELSPQQGHFIGELEGSSYSPQPNGLYPQPLKPQGQTFRAELAGDSYIPPQVQHETKPGAPPENMHPAYQRSPQPSPGLPSSAQSPQPSPRLPSNTQSPDPSARSGSTGGGYRVVNAERPDHNRQSSQQSIEAWQRNIQNDTPIDSSYYRNSRHSHGQQPIEPDHQRFSNLSIQQNASSPDDDRSVLPSQKTSKCPVCGLFEGDETAVSHHVSKAHFNN